MAMSVDCPACKGTGMVGASSCGKCRGTGTLRAAPAPEVVGGEGDAGADKRLKVRGPAAKLATAGRKTHKGLSFKR